MDRTIQETVVAVAADGTEIIVLKHDYEQGQYPELVLKGEEKPRAKAKKKAAKK